MSATFSVKTLYHFSFLIEQSVVSIWDCRLLEIPFVLKIFFFLLFDAFEAVFHVAQAGLRVALLPQLTFCSSYLLSAGITGIRRHTWLEPPLENILRSGVHLVHLVGPPKPSPTFCLQISALGGQIV